MTPVARGERKCLDRRFPPASGGEAVSNELNTTNQKERNDDHENRNRFQHCTSHHSPFTIRFHSHRTCAWHPCACPEGGSGKSATGRRLSQPQHCRGGFCAL